MQLNERSLLIPKTLNPSKEVWIGWISSLAEAYNMAIYSFTAPFLAHRLFQHSSESSAIFFSYALVLIGYCFLYPLGAVYFGSIGDKQGRQNMCIYSTLGLAVATGLLGLVPIDVLGGYAWLCFLILIGAQHFFSGGEYHGSIVYSLEHSEKQGKGGIISAMSCLFAVFGLVAANGLATLASIRNDELGIRLCFLVGAGGGLVSYFLKNYCRETPAFISVSKDQIEEISLLALMRQEWRKISTAVLILAFFMVSYTFLFIFLPLMQDTQSFDTVKSLIAYGVNLVAAGLLADRIGIKKVMGLGLCLFSLAIIPLCFFSTNLLTLQLLLTPPACLVIAPLHSWMLHLFEPKYRCRGIFISSAIAMSIFGGSTVPLCLLIFDMSHSLVLCGLYPLAIALSCLVSFLYKHFK